MSPKNFCLGCMNEKTDTAVCPYCGCAAGNYRNHPQDMKPGVLLKGRYLIGSSLGSTDYTITYIAYDLRLDQKVTVTEYFPSGKAARGMNGISVITCPIEMKDGLKGRKTDGSDFYNFVVFEENSTVYTVTEEADNPNFEEFLYLNGGRLSFEKSVKLFRPVMHEIEAIHSVDSVYGQVDAKHILVTEDGKGMLTGLGKILLNTLASHIDDGIGTNKAGQSADIRRLATVMFQALSGSAPHDISGSASMERPLVYDVYGFKIPVSIENAISHAMNPDAAFPFASMREFESAFTIDTKREKAVRQNSYVKLRKRFFPFGRY